MTTPTTTNARSTLMTTTLTIQLSLLLLLLLLLPVQEISSFVLLTTTSLSLSSSSSSSLSAASVNVNGNVNNCLPRDVKDAVSICRQSVQDALGKRVSRMDVEMPVGAKFGVETGKKGGKKKSARQQEDGVSRDVLEMSDRELARLFVDMFQPVGGENIAVVFREGRQAEATKKKWALDSTAQCRVMSVAKGSTGGKSKKKKKMGFAAKLAAELDSDVGGPFSLPKNCEVAIFISPGPKELIAIERICNEVGMGTLVILLNARLGMMEKVSTFFQQEFEPVFHLAAAPQDVAPDCLLHRAYPSDWLIARKPKVGQPKVIGQQAERFSSEDCQEALESMEMTDFEKAAEGVLDNVANWFR